ncbi:MAG TPA: CpaD family pilus assembly protein [Beijerinckiaceae bacterium]|nr:CpaD family pilus assembly protein [Beijerinckiaceae bacterium]
MARHTRAHSARSRSRRRCVRLGRRLIAASTLAAALSACAADRVVTGSVPTLGYQQRHPIVLTEGAHTLDVFVTGQAGLDGRQRDDIRAFAAEYRRSGQGAVLAQVPAGARNDGGAHATMARVNAELAAAGLPPGYLAVSAYPVLDPFVASPIRLSFVRLTAKVTSPCGTWPRDLGISDAREGIRNDTYWNFGCAMQSNVAAQVADPVDLVRPRTEGRPDPIRRAKVIDAVREGQDPSTQWRQEGTKINQGVGE